MPTRLRSSSDSLAGFGAELAVIGGPSGFSAYLTYRELFDIQAICQWCVASAILMTALAAICVARTICAPMEER